MTITVKLPCRQFKSSGSRSKGKRKPSHDKGDSTQYANNNDDTRPRQFANEIVSLIIDHVADHQAWLYECTVVSKQFHAIANPRLWKHLTFNDNEQLAARFVSGLYDATPQRLDMLGQPIRTLHLLGGRWTDSQFVRFIPTIPHLQHLTVHHSTYISDISFLHLPYHCQHLVSLHLDTTRLSEMSFAMLGRHCRHLKQLRMDIHHGHGTVFVALLTPCPLEQLTIHGIYAPLHPTALAAIRTFDLTDLKLNFWTTPMKQLLRLHGWPHLRSLKLGSCQDVDDATLEAFLAKHPNLTDIDLQVVHLLSDTSLHAMAKLPNLTSVRLLFCYDATANGVRSLIIRCNTLTYVELDNGPVCEQDFPELFVDGVSQCWNPDNFTAHQKEIDLIRQANLV